MSNGFNSPIRTSTFGLRHKNSDSTVREEVVTGPQPGYFWIEHLPRSINDINSNSPLSPHKDNWKIESAKLFITSVRKVVETICSRGRSVWFMVRPLESRALLSGPSEANVSFSHWGILISGMTRSQLEDRLGDVESDAIWGDLHELRNYFGNARYEWSTYQARHNQRATKLDYLGQTEITDEALFEFGIDHRKAFLMKGHELIRLNPKYHLLKNNCQVWVEKFLAKVCPSAEIEKTIAQVLRSSSK